MRVLLVSTHLPVVDGTATGQVLRATADGLIELGHDVEVVSWTSEQPAVELPSWARWTPAPVQPWPVRRVRGLVRPRSRSALLRLDIEPDTVAIAEEFPSFAAVAPAPRSVLSVHYSASLDHAATRQRRAGNVQDRRAERRALRQAALVTAYSDRVAATVGAARVVPVPVLLPPEPLPLVAEPVAVLLANYSWPANRIALDRLLAAWPRVREQVPGARLLVAGRGPVPAAAPAGVELLGPVAHATDVLARAAVLAFPCPPTSGPKVKVLEALAFGLPVVTTAAGAEGVAETAALVVADDDGFASALAATLGDAARRADLAARGRTTIETHHAPPVAARARVRVLHERFGT